MIRQREGVTPAVSAVGVVLCLIVFCGICCARQADALGLPGRAAMVRAASTTTYDVGMLAHFPMDEGTGTNITDTESVYTGTFVSSPSWITRSGGYAVQFDGTNDAISIASPGALVLTSGQPFSYSFWVRLDIDSPSVFVTPITHRAFNYGWGALIGASFSWYLRAYGPAQWLQTSSITNKGNWRHIVVTFDGSDAVVYANGLSVKTATGVAFTAGTTAYPIYIGNDATSTYPIDGAIDDVRIWDRALTPQEIHDLYRATK